MGGGEVDDAIEKAVQRVIESMHENLAQQITVDDMARTANFSKFHFCRVFQRVTGTSPGRFLTALRIQRAKHLLVSTSLNVKDISHEVGYSSVGTFSSRFSSSVGVPPGRFRKLGGHPPLSAGNRRQHPGAGTPGHPERTARLDRYARADPHRAVSQSGASRDNRGGRRHPHAGASMRPTGATGAT